MNQSEIQLKSTLSYLAGALFCLAAIIEMIAGSIGPHRHIALIATGGMFLAVGCLWLVIAANSTKKRQH
jgi:predicted lysophospholipase L1 biosynthesis ABC-type transport system permease subunit